MYGEIRFCASLTSSNVGMYIMLSLFLQILDNIPVPPKLRNQAKLENSNQTTPFLQWRFRTKPSHPSDSTNVRCEKLFLQLCRAMIPTPNIDTYNGHTHSTTEFQSGIYHYHVKTANIGGTNNKVFWVTNAKYYGTPGSITVR